MFLRRKTDSSTMPVTLKFYFLKWLLYTLTDKGKKGAFNYFAKFTEKF